jgi:hypothetical protein
MFLVQYPIFHKSRIFVIKLNQKPLKKLRFYSLIDTKQ